METKICKICGIEKYLSEFRKSTTNHLGCLPTCKECMNWNHRSTEDKEKEQTRWRLLAMGFKYCPNCDTIKLVNEFSPQKSRKDSLRAYCLDCDRKRNLSYSRTEQGRAIKLKYESSERYFQKLKDRYYKKKNNNPDYTIELSIRSSLATAVKRCGIKRKNHYINLIGCSNFDLYDHLEAQFEEGMTWNNHNRYGWHIDHIIPMNAFDLNDPLQYMACCNWRNLQPMWGTKNIQKGAKYKIEDFNRYMDIFRK
jgi:hypothetical protein